MQIKAENLTKSFGGSVILEQLTMEVKAGEHVALVGRNGCGKTTLLSLLARIESPDEVVSFRRRIAKSGIYIRFLPIRIYSLKMYC